MVVDELDTLLSNCAECRTIAFADLSTQMILVTDTASTLPREALDRLCKQAAASLGLNGQTVLGEKPGQMAVLADKSTVNVFLRATEEPDDVLCCVCAPDVDLTKFVADATACVNRISSGQSE